MASPQKVIVTGAAQGIGRAVALRLAVPGAHLAVWEVHSEGIEETARLCRDIGRPEDITAVVAFLLSDCRLHDRAVGCGERRRDHDSLSLLIDRGAGVPDHVAPLLEILAQRLCHLLRRRGDDLHALRRQRLHEFRIGRGLLDLARQAVDDAWRRPGRRKHAEP